jgi:hypothetical protein
MSKLTAKQFERECANPYTTEPLAVQARNHAAAAGANIAASQTNVQAKIKPAPGTVGEVKTDITFGSDRVSVKFEGDVQLTSAEGTTTANMFRAVKDTFPADLQDTFLACGLDWIITSLQQMPVRGVAPQNIKRVLLEQPSTKYWDSKNWFQNGKLLPQYDYGLWDRNIGTLLDSRITQFLETHPLFAVRLVEEALTGCYTMGRHHFASATHILTPFYYTPIDDAYIQKVYSNLKCIRISQKSRKGVTSGTLRMDYKVCK